MKGKREKDDDSDSDSDGDGDGDGNGDELLVKLEMVGNNGWLLWNVFFLCTIACTMNGLHLTSYVYLAEIPTHWCHLPQLSALNWTKNQIRDISSPSGSNESSCEYYDWDYRELSEMSFADALDHTKSQDKPELLRCSSYDYADGLSSMVIDYDLVCQRATLKSMIQVSLSFGKFGGALLFGILSDKFGRKLSFLLGCLLYITSGPMVAYAINYSMIMAGRIGLGAASSGIYQASSVLLSEIASKKRRATLGILFNISYPFGQMIVPMIAYFFRDWRTLQIIISLPIFLIFIFYWFLPESPRWLILKNRRAEAAQIINKAYSKLVTDENLKVNDNREIRTIAKQHDFGTGSEKGKSAETKKGARHKKESDSFWLKMVSMIGQIIELIKHNELRCRMLISLLSWCICSLSYYSLALNVDNFHSDRYVYGFLTGLVEVPSYIISLPLLRYFGRRQTSISLLYVGGFALLLILLLPEDQSFLLIVASIGRLCASAVFAVVTLHTTEMFPTLLRNTALGCCATAAHIGSMSAPLIVDILGAYAWFIPSTVCGVATLIAGTMIFLLPETKNKPLPDTVDDILKGPNSEKVGFHQICSK